MHKRNRLYVTIAIAWGLAGGLLALIRLIDPGIVPGNAARAHGHIMLLGFVLMTIYGVALHVLPRFSGYPLRSERLANLQFWCANTGLPLMVAGWFALLDWLVIIGGALSAAAMVLFALNMVLTVRLRSPLDR